MYLNVQFLQILRHKRFSFRKPFQQTELCDGKLRLDFVVKVFDYNIEIRRFDAVVNIDSLYIHDSIFQVHVRNFHPCTHGNNDSDFYSIVSEMTSVDIAIFQFLHPRVRHPA